MINYLDLYDYSCVVRLVALSGGYANDKACELLAKNNKMIASFSRALLEGLTVNQTEEEFEEKLGSSIKQIFEASNT
jgi:fructose-bisphosphate aldolase class I